MPSSRGARILFVCLVVAALALIGRNIYRRQLNKALFHAIEARDPAAVKSLLERGADVKATQNNTTPLASALLQFNPLLLPVVTSLDPAKQTPPPPGVPPDAETIACLLIEKGAALRLPRTANQKAADSIAPLEDGYYVQEACRYGSIPTLRCLLDKGAHVNRGCLQTALDYGNTQVFITKGISIGPRAEDTTEQARRRNVSRQMIALLRAHGLEFSVAQAVLQNDIALLKILLERGASPDGEANLPQTPLTLAADKGNVEAVKLLLAHHADVNRQGSYRDTPLVGAAGNGSLEIVKLLLAHGAGVNVGNSQPPLLRAIWGRHLDVARLLLSRGAAPNLNAGGAGDSILEAAIYSLPELVPQLLQCSANVNAHNGEPLRRALKNHHASIVQELLRRGALVNPEWHSEHPNLESSDTVPKPFAPFSPLATAVCFAPEWTDRLLGAGATLGSDKETILAWSAKSGRPSLFAQLLALGAAINGTDVEEETALTQAIQHAPDSVEMLLAHGANPNVVTRGRRTPLDLAAGAGNVRLMRLLIAHGANVNACPPRGHTPLFWARKNSQHRTVTIMNPSGTFTPVQRGHNNPEVVQALVQAGATVDN